MYIHLFICSFILLFIYLCIHIFLLIWYITLLHTSTNTQRDASTIHAFIHHNTLNDLNSLNMRSKLASYWCIQGVFDFQLNVHFKVQSHKYTTNAHVEK